MGHAVAGHCAQHDRTAEIGRNVLRSISPLPVETGTSRARCQDHIHVAYEYLQGRRLPTCLWTTWARAHCPRSKVVFTTFFGVSLLCPSLCQLSPLGTSEHSLAPSSLHPPVRYFWCSQSSEALVITRIVKPNSFTWYSHVDIDKEFIYLERWYPTSVWRWCRALYSFFISDSRSSSRETAKRRSQLSANTHLALKINCLRKKAYFVRN